jgi:hypothetical protein
MVGSLAQLANRPFLVGFLVPALIALIGGVYAFQDLMPSEFISAIFKDGGEFDKLFYIVVFVWCAGLILSMTNTAQYQLLEGLSSPVSDWTFAARYQRIRLEKLRAEAQEMRSKIALHVAPDEKLKAEFIELTLRLRQEYPRKPERVLPTQFGNRIRAFEDFAENVHGADAVTVWPALISVVPKDFQAIIDNARANVDFLVNIIFLSFLIGVSVLMRALYLLVQPFDPWAPWMSNLPVSWYFSQILTASIAFAIGILAYHFSLRVIPGWGHLVRVTFDAYLPALARQLGYELPTNLEKRREFWMEVSQQIAIHNPMQPEKWLKQSEPQQTSLVSTRKPK